jgi:hypothetical protein
MPSAAASNARHWPLGDITFALQRKTLTSGERIRFTPPASARSDSPETRLWQARWTATSDELQVASTVRPGPTAPRKGRGGRQKPLLSPV